MKPTWNTLLLRFSVAVALTVAACIWCALHEPFRPFDGADVATWFVMASALVLVAEFAGLMVLLGAAAFLSLVVALVESAVDVIEGRGRDD